MNGGTGSIAFVSPVNLVYVHLLSLATIQVAHNSIVKLSPT